MSFLLNIFNDVLTERDRQDEKWGEQHHPDGVGQVDQIQHAIDVRERTEQKAQQGKLTWADILDEENAEVLAAHTVTELREELVQTAAVCFAWIEALDKRATTYENPDVGPPFVDHGTYTIGEPS